MSYTCGLVDQPLQPVISMRFRTPAEKLPQALSKTYQTIMKYLDELGEDPPAAPFSAYYNMDMQDLDVEAGFLVWEKLPEKNGIQSSQIPSGKYAVCIHTGAYNKIEAAYDALMNWVKEKGYTPTGISYELYWNDPTITPEDELKTRLMFPLESGK